MPGVICPDSAASPRDCRPLYYLPRWWWKPEPDPRLTTFFGRLRIAFSLLFGPLPPCPWLDPELLKTGATRETLRDASILGAMGELATSLSPGLRGSIAQQLDGAVAQLSLPKGVVLR